MPVTRIGDNAGAAGAPRYFKDSLDDSGCELMGIWHMGMGAVASLCLIIPAHAAEPLTSLDAAGLRTELETLKGRIILVNFWATWCRACLEEIPTLIKLETNLRHEGLSLVAVSLDEPDSGDTLVRPFIDEWFPGFRSYLSSERDMDSMVSVVDRTWNEILPTSYLIDRKGTVVERIQGKKSAEEFTAKILAVIESTH